MAHLSALFADGWDSKNAGLRSIWIEAPRFCVEVPMRLLSLRTRRANRFRRVELFEVGLEAARQLRSCLVVRCLVRPRVARIQNLRRNLWAAHRNLQPEGRLSGKLHLVQTP